MVAEPELLRDIFVKDFNKFVDRGLPPFGHPIFDRALPIASGDQWKEIRVTVRDIKGNHNQVLKLMFRIKY